jgi:hypothetical protein
MQEDLVQKRKQVLTLKQSIDKQSSSHVRPATTLIPAIVLPVSQ